MGKILEKVEKREKHLDTDDYISLLHWYIKECDKINKQYDDALYDLLNEKIRDRNKLVEEFNSKRREMAENV